jgi:hypothetical protein
MEATLKVASIWGMINPPHHVEATCARGLHEERNSLPSRERNLWIVVKF